MRDKCDCGADIRLREVALVLGAVDGDVLGAARRLIRILSTYQWAFDRINLAIDTIDDEYVRNERDRVRREIRRVLRS